jgi:O-antigen ligase
VVQARGATPSPNMLASIIMIGVFFQLQKLSKNITSSNGKDYLILLTLLIGFSLTVSKTIICLLIGIILILYFNYKSILSNAWRLTTKISVFVLFIAYIIGTHFIIAKKGESFETLKGDYIAGNQVIETASYSVYPSQYWSLKEISFEVISQSFPWGFGPGKFNDFAHELKKNDAFPTHVPYPDPHSTYFGTLAENGLLGLIALIGIIYFVVKYSRNILNNHPVDQYMLACLPNIFIVIGIEAISTDVMNFPHYWILLILLVSIINISNQLHQKV